jgi:hypothetical protein
MKEDKKKVFIRTLGWPLVTVARDGIRSPKENKWLGMLGIGRFNKRKGFFLKCT